MKKCLFTVLFLLSMLYLAKGQSGTISGNVRHNQGYSF